MGEFLIFNIFHCTDILCYLLFYLHVFSPNIRATIAHGLWDGHIISELDDTKYIENSSRHQLRCFTHLLLSILLILSEKVHNENPPFPFSIKNVTYQPLFSFAAYTLKKLELLLEKLDYLHDFVSSTEILKTTSQDLSSRNDSIHKLTTVHSFIPEMKQIIFGDMYRDGTWTIEAFYNEYDMNIKLVNCGAARSLIEDIAFAVSSYVSSIMENHEQNLTKELNSRQKKRFLNLCSISLVTIDLYTFALYVAMSSIMQEMKINKLEPSSSDSVAVCYPPTNLLKAVERSRMVVSTFSTFSALNRYRAMKAANGYVASKHVKMILKHIGEKKLSTHRVSENMQKTLI